MNKIPMIDVQKAFNKAIRKRDGRCMIKDYDFCNGGLECSHFFKVSSNPTLRFYPFNAYTQCQRHHWKHHNISERPYIDFLLHFYPDELQYMKTVRKRCIKYSEPLKAKIIELCNSGKLIELRDLLRNVIAGEEYEY